MSEELKSQEGDVMAERQWSGKGPNGETVFLDDDDLIVVKSAESSVRLGYWCERWHQSRLLRKALSNEGWYFYFHVEIPESQRRTGETGKKKRWADSEEVPPPFCSWPEELQMSVARWILSISGPEDLVSQISVASVSLHHKLLSGFYIHLNIPKGVEI